MQNCAYLNRFSAEFSSVSSFSVHLNDEYCCFRVSAIYDRLESTTNIGIAKSCPVGISPSVMTFGAYASVFVSMLNPFWLKHCITVYFK